MQDFDSEGSPKGYSSSMLEVAKEFQKGDKDSFSGSSQQDTITAINTRLNAGMGPTVRHLTKKFNQTKGRDLSEDLEENFKRQLVANGKGNRLFGHPSSFLQVSMPLQIKSP